MNGDFIFQFTNTNSTTNTYTLTFPVRTLADVNNNSNLILQGDYNVNVGHPTSSLLPAITNTSNTLQVGTGITFTASGINVTGIVTATSFRGDGSLLSGVVSGIQLQQSGSAVVGGAATTINFSGATISNVSSGIATITIASAGNSTDFGDLISATDSLGACSSGNGGLQ